MCCLTKVLSIRDTHLLLDGRPFPFQGLSFFNALYNPTFSGSADQRRIWLSRFKEHGISALRIWCQWDFDRPFVDLDPDHTMYMPDGTVRDSYFARLVDLAKDADALDMILEVTLFSHEKQPNLPLPSLERASAQMARRLLPYRNLILQLWNEDSTAVQECYHAIKQVDAHRLVTNSPGFANDLGDDAQNQMLDLLSPHTVRRQAARFWEVAPRQIASLIDTYRKPVIDDEPARTGLVQFGGIEGGTAPEQHIAQIVSVREAGGYHTYHHDMFQNGYGHPATPSHGIPDPDHPFHRHVFAFLRQYPAW